MSEVTRRTFIRWIGGGAAAFGLGGSTTVMAGPFARPAEGVKHFVPADKKLSQDWVRSLFERGAPRVYRGPEIENIGMPVGGIGAGQLYLLGDGTLGSWQIFNKHHFSGYGATNFAAHGQASPVDSGFAVVARTAAGAVAASLDRKDFPGVTMTAQHPIGTIRYEREGFPLRVEMEAFSPFIPLDADASGLPATLFHISLENSSGAAVEARVIGWLENAVCFHSGAEIRELRTTRIAVEKGRRMILHGAAPAPPGEKPPARPPIVLADFEGGGYGEWKAEGTAFGSKPSAGTESNQQPVSGFEGKGLVNTYPGSDRPVGKLRSPPFMVSRRWINFLIGGGHHAGKTCMNLLVGDKVERTRTGKGNEKLEWASWDVAELEGKEASIEIVDDSTVPWGHINVDAIELSDERRRGYSGPVEALEDYGTLVLALAGEGADALPDTSRPLGRAEVPLIGREDAAAGARYPSAERHKAALSTQAVSIPPGGKTTVTFVLAWHFPNHARGNHYATRFGSAAAVAHHVLDHHERLAGDTRKWRDTYYDSTLPHWLLDRLHSTISYLATGTCQWWKNGRFWAWEGVGCCEGTCTHVWNYAQGMGRLFPELERSVREMQDLGSAFHPDGLIGFRGEQNGAYAADGQAGSVLKCWREHLMSADRSFLARNWPRIQKALEYSIRKDTDEDGLIETSQHNTYDINFEGPNTFVGGLFLAALRAGEEMAREMGDLELAGRLQQVFEKGSRASAERLWNGEYFIQDVDLKKHPKDQYGDGCLSDHVFGQTWAHQTGLGYIYPEERVKDALRAIWKYNWAPDIGPQNAAYKPERWFVSPGEAGLFMCTWPKSEHLDEGVRYKDEVWTGTEYQVASHMIREGMVTEGIVMIRAIHDRYDAAKRNPFNEVECGDHYARALASWGALISLSGYEHHGPKRHLGFAPAQPGRPFRSAFTAAEGWGTFSETPGAGGSQVDLVEVRWGRLRLKTLAFRAPAEGRPSAVTVRAWGRTLPATHETEGRRVLITLPEEIVIEAGGSIEVRIG